MTPEYINAISAAAQSARQEESFALLLPYISQSEEYTERKAHELGELFGISFRPKQSESCPVAKKAFLYDREKKLTSIVSDILKNENSHVRRIFGDSIETIVSSKTDVSARIGTLGKIIGLELWLESYPIIPV